MLEEQPPWQKKSAWPLRYQKQSWQQNQDECSANLNQEEQQFDCALLGLRRVGVLPECPLQQQHQPSQARKQRPKEKALAGGPDCHPEEAGKVGRWIFFVFLQDDPLTREDLRRVHLWLGQVACRSTMYMSVLLLITRPTPAGRSAKTAADAEPIASDDAEPAPEVSSQAEDTSLEAGAEDLQSIGEVYKNIVWNATSMEHVEACKGPCMLCKGQKLPWVASRRKAS